MSLVTRCTQCSTLFKVVADQLKISQGWVRCGQCSTVFDAQNNLVDEPVQASPALSAPSEKPTVAPFAPLKQRPNPDSFMPSVAASTNLDSLHSYSPSETPRAIDLIAPHAENTRAISIKDLKTAEVSSESLEETDLSALEADESLQSSLPASSSMPIASPSAAPKAPTAPLAPPAQPEFVRAAQRAQRWREPWVRLALAMLAVLLLAALAVQLAYAKRNELAAREPSLQPYLLQLCEQLQCTIAPPQLIEAISVDSSSFNILPSAVTSTSANTYYKLALTLKNTSNSMVDLPHIELSLRDGQDQVLTSRVLSPADLGMTATSLQPSAELAASATVQVSAQQLGGQRVSGYRVYAFYP